MLKLKIGDRVRAKVRIIWGWKGRERDGALLSA